MAEAKRPRTSKPAAEPVELRVDIDSFSIGEIEDVEEACGLSFATIINRFTDPEGMRGQAVKALVWVLRRREDPSVTLEDVRSMRLSAVRLKWGDDAAEDPTPSPSGDEAA